MTKAYKLEVLIVDHDELGAEEIAKVIEEQKYPNWCIYPYVIRSHEKDIGEWDDDHPLNQGCMLEEFDRVFGDC